MRPESIVPVEGEAEGFTLNLRSTLIEHTGSENLVVFELGENEVIGKFPAEARPKVDEIISVGLDLSRLSVFDAETENRV